MTSLSLAWRAVDPADDLVALIDGQVRAQYAGVLSAKTNVHIAARPIGDRSLESLAEAAPAGQTVPAILHLRLDPAEGQLMASAVSGVAHFLRLADATLKQLEPQADPISLAPGDAYVAVVPWRPPLAPEARLAAARFIHLRDYFNADKMAADLLKHLLADGGPAGQPPPTMGALVIECR